MITFLYMTIFNYMYMYVFIAHTLWKYNCNTWHVHIKTFFLYTFTSLCLLVNITHLLLSMSFKFLMTLVFVMSGLFVCDWPLCGNFPEVEQFYFSDLLNVIFLWLFCRCGALFILLPEWIPEFQCDVCVSIGLLPAHCKYM